MNAGLIENEFRLGLAALVEGLAREQAPEAYAGAGQLVLHEHDTRIFFFDRLLSLLGWRLGLGGDVAEEARVKADTTRFVDYLGIDSETRAPTLIVEAKAWDKPFISGVIHNRSLAHSALIVTAIEYIRNGGDRASAPVVGEWHDYLSQLARYVINFKQQYGHEVPCAMLASGRWLLVFTNPTATFVDGPANDTQFRIFFLNNYVANAHHIHGLLARSRLAPVAPPRLRSTQLGHYVAPGSVDAAFHALLVRYEKTGATLFAPQPRILVYPAILVQREDGTLFTIIDDEEPIVVDVDRIEGGHDSIAAHIARVTEGAERLLARCAAEVGGDLAVFDLGDFAGWLDVSDSLAADSLPLGRSRRKFVKPLRDAPDQWLVVTGVRPHFLLAEPRVACRFHSWSECRTVHQAIGMSSINSRATESPRAFFVDEQIYHCAHQDIQDRREGRCHIAPIDLRTCCSACGFQEICWDAGELARLPCGR